MTLAVDRELLDNALRELVRLRRTKTVKGTWLVSGVYSAALNEWAESLGVDPRKLNKLVLVVDAVPDRRTH